MKNLSKKGHEELQEMINEYLQQNDIENMEISDIHHEIFNTDYFIIGYYQAEKWLNENYGIFNAMDKIKEYELDNFGEFTTDISSSEKVVNMLAYILGEELLYSMELNTI